MTSICANLQVIGVRIAAACAASGRDPAEVLLLAVGKTWPAHSLREAAACGQRAFGESYVQEAVAKIGELSDLDLEWHFIGPLQSNKTRPVAESFDWVHGVDRLKIAERLSAQRPADRPPLNVCVEVNLSGEASKAGCAPSEAAGLCRAVAGLPNLRLRGLMAIPEPTEESAAARRRFAALRELRDAINGDGLGLDTLSMGMSHDLEAAIMEGATIVRVGTAIFGERE
ncbi:MAG: YggS family pyridoxal phosphate-dependent enzyme [Candidatus Nitricoxidivorans perseverans]|uniref:Pyridoxal phosphate homeostasis protein n=1 Tax=Candidatus Nitricoxidivorans perseverans TaxID=2975601 RepID=A0AA49FIC7_9PROT|nr:MAG: YggS family pyridoxal phosphate-dependent enzyme [Candidatus Nitricoxidivorans perseverans]